MDELVKAAQDEGELNVIALPPDWANYGEIIKAFEDKYDIKVNSDQPDAASQDEINAANDLKGTDHAPDVFDLGQSVALANTDMFAPYQVQTWDDIPDEFKDPDGAWVNDYGGYMSIGYDSAKVPDVDLARRPAGPEYKGEVALNGDPTQAGAGVQRRDDGRDRQRRLGRRHRARRRLLQQTEEGRQLPPRRPRLRDDRVRARRRSSSTGTTSARPRRPTSTRGRSSSPRSAVVARLLLPGHQRRRAAPGRRAAVAGVPLQRRGPEPVARRAVPARSAPTRWPRPARSTQALCGALPEVSGDPVIPTDDQTMTAGEYLADNWSKAIS